MANYLTGGTKLTGFWLVGDGSYSYLGTLNPDGWVHTRNHGKFVPDPDTVRMATKNRGTSAADRNNWGRSIGMVKTNRMGLLGAGLLGEAKTSNVFVGEEDIIARHPNIKDLPEEEKDTIRRAFAKSRELLAAE